MLVNSTGSFKQQEINIIFPRMHVTLHCKVSGPLTGEKGDALLKLNDA